ncbi:SUF system NifU family Fe-S cluster assembly protein [Candidatus Micrarchaeota archaeon]|nr:SUF system NifU family Fe-S cluster assembly protein [Candidatus Micrarchaeota archaeon]
MYTEMILDYYKFPRNFGTLEKADIKSRDTNPLCGDEIEFQINLDENKKVKEVKYSGKGCAISQAAASMLTELMQGKTVDELKKISKGDIYDLLGITLSPVRVKCALLGLKVMKIGVYTYLSEEIKLDEDEK